MKRIIIFIGLIIPALCMADDPTNYYSLHNETVTVTYQGAGDVGDQTAEYSGYPNIYNPNNSKIVCGTISNCSPGNTITFPTVSTSSSSRVERFRVFVPPGTTSVDFKINTNGMVRAAVRMNYVPVCDGCNDPGSLSYTSQGSYELRYLDLAQVYLKTENNEIRILNGSPYGFQNDDYPLAENHSGWVYVYVFSGRENIESVSYRITVNSWVYEDWYNNYFGSSQGDAFGLSNSGIIPTIAAFAGSQVLNSYGLEITEALLEEIGLMFQDSAGTSFDSVVETGDGTIIPMGCCTWACCVGVGIMSSPLGVARSFASFATKSISGLTSLFASADLAFLQHWSPITTELAKNRTTLSELMKAQDQEFHQKFVQFGMAQQELNIQQRFGPNAITNSQRIGPEIGEVIQNNKKAEPELTALLSEKTTNYRQSFYSPEEIKNHHLSKPNDELGPTTLISPDGTMDTEGIKVALAMTELIIDPSPELEIATSADNSNSTKYYEYLRTLKQSRIAVSQHLMSENIAAQSPTIDAAVANKILELMGSAETISENKISSRQFMELLTNLRSANPNWPAEMAGKNAFGVTKEMLITQAFKLQRDLNELMKLEKQVLLMAQSVTFQTEQVINPQLKDAYKLAVRDSVSK